MSLSGITYLIRRSSRAKRITITVKRSGDVLVTLPYGRSMADAEHFVQHKAVWIRKTQEQLQKRFENKIVLKQTRKDYIQHKEQVRELIKQRILHFNQFYKYEYKRISIKNHSTRWGSCSKKGNLNFNYGLIYLPPEIVDYIIVHELCHLKELNHSERFWNLVAKAVPNHISLRKALKENYIHVS